MPYALWIVRGFCYVPQSYEIKIKGYETSGAYGLSSLSEKTIESNLQLQMLLRRQRFLLGYLKNLNVGPARVRTHNHPHRDATPNQLS